MSKKRRRIGIIDLVSKSPDKSWYGKLMRANLASIMPQVLAVWCEEENHDVFLSYYSGYRPMTDALPDDLDIVFIGAFTSAAQLAYALSAQFRAKGVVTVLGGPHARCYPTDARKYFDYVLGFTDKDVVNDVLADCAPQQPVGVHLTAAQQPSSLPGVQRRWKYIERLLEEAPMVKIVAMIGSLGCPYTCSFCVDSVVPYQPLDFDELKSDLRFLRTKMKRPAVGWHDPNFGIRFDDYLGAIEEAVPPGSVSFIAESSLALLNEENVKRLAKNGFKAMLPGIESWFEMGNKSRTGRNVGLEKVKRVAEQVNMILRHLPYLQANFVLGLDSDEGPEPFELTKKFLDLAPGAFPAYSMLTAFGSSAPLNLEYQKQGRVIPFPFRFLDNNGAMNVRPANYSWTEFYDKMIDLHRYSFSTRAIRRRAVATGDTIPRILNTVRAVSSEGWGKIRYYKSIRNRLQEDVKMRSFFEQESLEIPEMYTDAIRKDLGHMWEWLPENAMVHNPNAYLDAQVVEPTVLTQAVA